MAIQVTGGTRTAAELRRRMAALEPALNALGRSYAGRGQESASATSLYEDRSGNLRQSTFGDSEKTTVRVGATMDYAIHVHEGTSRMAARPFITATVNELAPQYAQDAATLVKRVLG